MCRCGHDARRHYSGTSPTQEQRGGNYCAALDCRCRGFRQSDEPTASAARPTAAPPAFGSTPAAPVREPTTNRPFTHLRDASLEELRAVLYRTPGGARTPTHSPPNESASPGRSTSPFRGIRTEGFRPFTGKGGWATLGALLYAIAAATWMATNTPAAATSVLGYGVANLGYAFAAAALIGIRICGLSKRWQIVLAGALCVIIGTLLSNMMA